MRVLSFVSLSLPLHTWIIFNPALAAEKKTRKRTFLKVLTYTGFFLLHRTTKFTDKKRSVNRAANQLHQLVEAGLLFPPYLIEGYPL